MKATLSMCIAAALVAGCAVQQPSIVQQPTTARPQPMPAAVPADGAIFQAGSYKPFFEDRTPVRVGDILTVSIEEKTQSSSSETSEGSRSASVKGSIDANLQLPFFSGYLENRLAGTSLNGSGSASQNGKGKNSSSSSFSSSISVTVIDVLANGNLMVSGEKQMRINDELEFIRLSGVVNPRDIKTGNTVSSTRLADARLEQINQGTNRLYNETGWLQRFFLSVLPF